MSGTTYCKAKRRHETEERAAEVLAGWREEAEKELARWEARGRTGKKPRPAPIRSYKCPHCGGWHLTSAQKHGRMEIDGKSVYEQWSHPRDAAPFVAEREVRMHPFAANELRTSDPFKLLDLMLASLDRRAGWRVRKSMERIERGGKR